MPYNTNSSWEWNAIILSPAHTSREGRLRRQAYQEAGVLGDVMKFCPPRSPSRKWYLCDMKPGTLSTKGWIHKHSGIPKQWKNDSESCQLQRARGWKSHFSLLRVGLESLLHLHPGSKDLIDLWSFPTVSCFLWTLFPLASYLHVSSFFIVNLVSSHVCVVGWLMAPKNMRP